MSSPFLGELRCVSFAITPRGWTQSNGQIIAIQVNQALFSLFGTVYGGDGRTTFGLPDLRGRAATHVGEGLTLGERAGEYAHTLTIAEMPQHPHFLNAVNATQNSNTPQAHMMANTAGNLGVYGPAQNLTAMFGADVSNYGSSLPHANQSPYLVLNWLVALQGIFPSQT